MQIDVEKFSWFQVSEDIKQLLILAAEHWENTAESEKYINQALAKTEESTDVLVAAYRYFFYKNNYHMALQIAVKVIANIKASEQLLDNWEQAKPILISRKEEPKIRLYLNTYAAYGMVLAKLGEIDKAKKSVLRSRKLTIKMSLEQALYTIF